MRIDPFEAKDEEHNFCELWSGNFPLFLGVKVSKTVVESSRASLASRTHFEVLGLKSQVLGFGLEASSPRKLLCPQLEDSTIF